MSPFDEYNRMGQQMEQEREKFSAKYDEIMENYQAPKIKFVTTPHSKK